MSQDFEKVLVKDNRIANISDKVKYAVLKGGQSVTSATFKAVSEGNTSHTYNIQVPSEQTLIDRLVLWRSTMKLAVVYTNNSANPAISIDYGRRCSLAPFPLHQMVSVMTATLNNSSVSVNMRDVLPFILRMNDRRELFRYNGYTPTAFDTYGSYDDSIDANNSPFSAYQNMGDNDLAGRGCWVIDSVNVYNNATNVLLGTSLSTSIPAGVSARYEMSFTVTEPLLLSPFIFCNPKSNNQAFYGVTNMNFVMNIGDASRVWRTTLAQDGIGDQVFSSPNNVAQLVSFTNSELIFNFLTPHPSDLLPARNVVGYYELPRYITQNLKAIPAGGEAQIDTSTLQLNQIPDKLFVGVRKKMSSQTNLDADCWFPIRQISVNWNNNSGILSSATSQDLYRYSVENGSNQSWLEWQGQATGNRPMSLSPPTPLQVIRTTGSMLCLEFGKDIQIVEDYYACGSLGNFNLQLRLNIVNNQGVQLNADAYEIVIITMNSGVMAFERGTASVYTGILNKQDVLDVSTGKSYSRSDVQRLVGGAGFLDNIKSIAGNALNNLPAIAKTVLGAIPDPRAQAASSIIGMLGGKKKMEKRLA